MTDIFDRADEIKKQIKEDYSCYNLDEENLKLAFLIYKDGYEKSKPKWHDLRKSPDDLPTTDGEYWTYNEWGYYDIHKWESQLWKECKVIAWCELSKFEE